MVTRTGSAQDRIVALLRQMGPWAQTCCGTEIGRLLWREKKTAFAFARQKGDVRKRRRGSRLGPWGARPADMICQYGNGVGRHPGHSHCRGRQKGSIGPRFTLMLSFGPATGRGRIVRLEMCVGGGEGGRGFNAGRPAYFHGFRKKRTKFRYWDNTTRPTSHPGGDSGISRAGFLFGFCGHDRK